MLQRHVLSAHVNDSCVHCFNSHACKTLLQHVALVLFRRDCSFDTATAYNVYTRSIHAVTASLRKENHRHDIC
jgi:hypothetical protein